jgi:predicted MFS family arabinose efflux permease
MTRLPARVHLLAAGGFAVGTSAYVVAGVLPAVGAELGVSESAAGQLSTVFALSYAVGAPLLAVATGRWERRALLTAALAAAALGNALAALAPTYPLLLGSRVVAALGAAAFTPAAALVATMLSPAERRGGAVAAVYGGLTLALVLGVPAGSVLGGTLGHRGVFAVIAGSCLLAAVAVRALLPRVTAPDPPGLRERLAVAADPRVLAVLATTVLTLLAGLTVYTYAAPLLAATAGVTGPQLGLLLLGYGVGSFAGNALGGRLSDRFGSTRPLLVLLPVLVAVLATMPLTTTTPAGAAVALALLGGAGWATNSPVQSRLIALAPTGSGLLLSLNASAVYLGAGLSGLVGGAVVDGPGVRALAPVAAVAAAGALVALLLSVRRPRPTGARVASDR